MALAGFRLKEADEDLLNCLASLQAVGQRFLEHRSPAGEFQDTHQIEQLGGFHQGLPSKVS